jgi:RNA polymerase sigma factor (sigma-70 family)
MDDRSAKTDAELMRMAKADPQAFGEIYRRHAPQVAQWFRRTLPSHAADLTAETFARGWLSRRSFRDEREGSALPWLLGIARNVLVDSIRRERLECRARERLGLPVVMVEDERFDAVDRRLSASSELKDALLRLPEHERDAVELRVLGDMPFSDVARVLAIRPAAARLRVSRALRRLARALRDEPAPEENSRPASPTCPH